MKNKQDGGFSLIEVVLAMVILALIVVPTCSSLVLSFRVNAKAEALLQAQLAVSSAVEELMAKGIVDARVPEGGTEVYDIVEVAEDNDETEGTKKETDLFPDVRISVTAEDSCYKVEVTDNNDLVTVTTYIRGGGSE